MHPTRGRVYRRCACRGTTGIWGTCGLELAGNSRHGRWAFAVDMPTLTGTPLNHAPQWLHHQDRRPSRARPHHGPRTRRHRCQRPANRRLVPNRLADRQGARTENRSPWPATPTALIKDLIPGLGAIRLEHLYHRRIAQFVIDQLAAGRRLITLRRCLATLSSTLNDPVGHRRLPHNPARYTALAPRVERVSWTPQQAVVFLHHCNATADPLAPLYETHPRHRHAQRRRLSP